MRRHPRRPGRRSDDGLRARRRVPSPSRAGGLTPPVPGLAEPGFPAMPGCASWTGRPRLYPGSPSPAFQRFPAAHRGQDGLGEAVYRRPPCTRARRARHSSDARLRIADGTASARPSTKRPPVPGLAEPGSPAMPGCASRTGRPRRGRLQKGRLYPGSPSPALQRCPAAHLGRDGLGEAVYKGPPCTRARRARLSSDSRLRIADRTASARPSTVHLNKSIRLNTFISYCNYLRVRLLLNVLSNSRRN